MHLPAPATGLVARIERGAIHDGPGLRTVVYMKGCPLRCLWCHSPETQSNQTEILLLRDRCIGCGTCVGRCTGGAALLDDKGAGSVDRSRCQVCGTCAEACPTEARQLCGQECSVENVMAEVLRDRAFFDQSRGGVTLSGGEPLLQPRFALALLDRCRKEQVHTAVETCGFVHHDVLRKAAALTDLFLFDVKVIDDRRHRVLTGASNVRIVANLKDLAAVHKNVIVRFPLVPGLNDDESALSSLGRFAASHGIRRIDVLPYHRAGIAKYERLDRPYRLHDVAPPDAALVRQALTTLGAYGVEVTAGGAA